MSTNPNGLLHEKITKEVIGTFFEVYNELGYGFLEQVYSAAMERLLSERGLRVDREFRVAVYLRGRVLTWQRLDMVVERCVVVENKSTEKLPAITPRKTLNYLHATRLEVALILHFGPQAKFYRVVSLNE